MLGIVVLCFLLLQMVPGDIADVLAEQAGSASAETIAVLRAQFGIDQPVLTQLVAGSVKDLGPARLPVSG